MLKIIGSLLGVMIALSLVPSEAQAQPAPNLRSVQVVAVQSTGYRAWDYTNGGVATPKDHRGPELWVVTFDNGYAITNSPKATFLGLKMREVKTEAYPSKGPILGYYRYWYISTPFSSGNFSYEANSINSGRKFGTSIFVR